MGGLAYAYRCGARLGHKAMVGNSRYPLFVDERTSTEDTSIGTVWLASQRRRMMPPMDQVGAGNMAPTMTLFILKHVKQMISALLENSAVNIEGRAYAIENRKVITGAVRIPQ